MLVPISWLKEYVDVDLSPIDLKNSLVKAGFEVEEIIDLANKINNVYSSKIISIKKHPSADKLIICEVASKDKNHYFIVTNDISLQISDIVPLALDGAVLYDGKIIHSDTIRDYKSDGMFCGPEEIGIFDFDSSAKKMSVYKFSDSTVVGEDVNIILGRNDIVLDISITANRSDANSILGIAREVSAITGKPLKKTFFEDFSTLSKRKELKCEIEASDKCRRYLACLVKDIKITDSPDYIKRRLKSVGINSINNIVDLTNYVMISVGQPLHAFDYSKISGNSIIVRMSKDTEVITALNGNKYTLNKSILAICNSNEPMAIAGVMGGKNHSIDISTKHIVLESANFARDSVRNTSRSLGLQSESSLRFEKGIDLYSQELGISLALQIIKDEKWGTAYSIYDSLTNIPQPKIVSFRSIDITKVLGISIGKTDIIYPLESLGFQVSVENDYYKCVVPRWRDDIYGINDIAEEIIRIIGYDRYDEIDSKRMGSVILGQKGDFYKLIEKTKEVLLGDGFSEVINYSFIPKKALDELNISEDFEDKLIYLLNPLSDEYALMRPILSYSMIKIIAKNFSRGNKNVKLFELGKTYIKESNIISELPHESYKLCFSSYSVSFFELKTTLERIMYLLRYDVLYKTKKLPFMHDYRCASVIDKKTGIEIGFIGEVKASISESIYDVTDRIVLCELNFDYLTNNYQGYKNFKNISKYQISDRDISIVIDKEVKAQDIIDSVSSASNDLLIDAYIYDVYYGAQVNSNQKSVSIKLRFQSNTHTLNDFEINSEMESIYSSLKEKYNAYLR